MNKAQPLSGLGLAMRAGKLVTGDEIVLKAIRSGEAKLVILAGDASANTQKKFRDKCGTYKIPLMIGFDRETLGGVSASRNGSFWLSSIRGLPS